MHVLLESLKNKTFSYIEAGILLPDVIEEVLNRFKSSVYTSDDRVQYNSLEAAKTKIIENIEKKIETKGFGSRREQTIIPRLEWLADIGILEREADKKYTYFIPHKGQIFIKMLYSYYIEVVSKSYVDEALAIVLNTKLFQCLYSLQYDRISKDHECDDIIQVITPCYKELKNITGYCLFRPLLLLTHIRRWQLGEQYVIEYCQAVEALEKAYKQNPKRFYFTTARFGEDIQVKLE